MHDNTKLRLQALIAALAGIALIGFNFYLRANRGSYFPLSVVVAGIIIGLSISSLIRPIGKQEKPTADHQKFMNVAGILGAAFGVAVWLLILD
jgi:hypothetical protein